MCLEVPSSRGIKGPVCLGQAALSLSEGSGRCPVAAGEVFSV